MGALGGAAVGPAIGLTVLGGAAVGGLAGAAVGGLTGAAFEMPWYYYPYWTPNYHPYYYQPHYAPMVPRMYPYYPMQWAPAPAFGYW